MVRPEGINSNALFEELEDWNECLSHFSNKGKNLSNFACSIMAPSLNWVADYEGFLHPKRFELKKPIQNIGLTHEARSHHQKEGKIPIKINKMKMVRPEGINSNALFEELEDWNHCLKPYADDLPEMEP